VLLAASVQRWLEAAAPEPEPEPEPALEEVRRTLDTVAVFFFM
jgi:hypothetical protein